MLKNKNKSKIGKQHVMIIVVLVLFFGTVFMWWRFFRQPSSVSTSITTIIPNNDASTRALSESQQAKNNTSTPLTLSEVLNSLERYGNWPITVPSLGRTNPFLATE